MRKRIGVLLSGRGSNFEALAESVAAGRIPNAEMAIVISNREDAPGIARAKARGIATQVIASKGLEREAYDRLVAAVLDHGKPGRVDAGERGPGIGRLGGVDPREAREGGDDPKPMGQGDGRQLVGIGGRSRRERGVEVLGRWLLDRQRLPFGGEDIFLRCYREDWE